MGIYERKDNETVMEHKKHDNPKWNMTILEFWIGDKSENGENNRTEQENNKMTFPNEKGQDEWGT